MEGYEERIKEIDRILSEEELPSLDRAFLEYLRFANESIGWSKEICRNIDKVVEEMSKLPIKENDMEEKKTKKMTKAEAFEYLKYKKVILRTEDEQVELQRFLFNTGYQWRSGRNVMKLYSDIACMFFLEGDGLITHSEYDQESDKLFCDTHAYKEIKLDDILSIEIVEEEEEDTSMPTVEFKRYVEILQAWSRRINSSFVFSERGMGIVRGDLLTKLEGEEKDAYYKIEATL